MKRNLILIWISFLHSDYYFESHLFGNGLYVHWTWLVNLTSDVRGVIDVRCINRPVPGSLDLVNPLALCFGYCNPLVQRDCKRCTLTKILKVLWSTSTDILPRTCWHFLIKSNGPGLHSLLSLFHICVASSFFRSCVGSFSKKPSFVVDSNNHGCLWVTLKQNAFLQVTL